MGEDAKKVQGRGQLFNFREKWQGLRHSSGWPWILMFIREVRVQRLERSSGFEDETSHSNDPRGGKLLQPWKQLRVNIPILKSPDIPLCLLPCSIITQQFLSVLLSCFLRYCSSCWHSLPLWLWAVFLRFNLLWDTHCSWRLNSIWTAWIIMLCLSTDWIRLNPPPPRKKTLIHFKTLCLRSRNRGEWEKNGRRKSSDLGVNEQALSLAENGSACVSLSHTLILSVYLLVFQT